LNVLGVKMFFYLCVVQMFIPFDWADRCIDNKKRERGGMGC
jgi:hypothetical protein